MQTERREVGWGGFPFSSLLSLVSHGQICASCHGDQARLHPGQRCRRSLTQVIDHKLPVEEAGLEQGSCGCSTSSTSAIPSLLLWWFQQAALTWTSTTYFPAVQLIFSFHPCCTVASSLPFAVTHRLGDSGSTI